MFVVLLRKLRYPINGNVKSSVDAPKYPMKITVDFSVSGDRPAFFLYHYFLSSPILPNS